LSSRWRFSLWSFLAGILAAVALVLTVAGMCLRDGFSARQKDGAFETALARFALRSSVSAHQGRLINPVSLSAEVIAAARDHFADHCASCHANNGSGHTMYGDGLNPPPPDLRLESTQSKSDGELYSIIQNGVRMSGMPAFGTPGEHDLETWQLVQFVRHLPSLTPEEARAMQQANPITPSELREQQEEDQFLQGISTQPKGLTK
jgi:mono/diheme cytochrome c family protein